MVHVRPPRQQRRACRPSGGAGKARLRTGSATSLNFEIIEVSFAFEARIATRESRRLSAGRVTDGGLDARASSYESGTVGRTEAWRRLWDGSYGWRKALKAARSSPRLKRRRVVLRAGGWSRRPTQLLATPRTGHDSRPTHAPASTAVGKYARSQSATCQTPSPPRRWVRAPFETKRSLRQHHSATTGSVR
jgi:hypothetical protein